MEKAFDRIMVIFFENENADLVLENTIFYKYAKKRMRLTNYYGVTHPSQPNYIALFGGDFFGYAHDECHDFHESNLIDLLENKGEDWRAYVEDYDPLNPLACHYGLYARRHNPIVSFKSNQTQSRLAKVQSATNFNPNGYVPSFVWYGPNLRNCGHTVPGSLTSGESCINIRYAANWLKSFLDPLLKNDMFMKGTLIVLTFDEDWPQKPKGGTETSENGKPIYTVLLGAGVTPGSTNDTLYNHYNLLATIEKNFNLGDLGRHDADAEPFNFLFDS
jgi:hypothetical protein